MFHYIYLDGTVNVPWCTPDYNSGSVPLYKYLDGTVNVPWSAPDYNSVSVPLYIFRRNS